MTEMSDLCYLRKPRVNCFTHSKTTHSVMAEPMGLLESVPPLGLSFFFQNHAVYTDYMTKNSLVHSYLRLMPPFWKSGSATD